MWRDYVEVRTEKFYLTEWTRRLRDCEPYFGNRICPYILRLQSFQMDNTIALSPPTIYNIVPHNGQ